MTPRFRLSLAAVAAVCAAAAAEAPSTTRIALIAGAKSHGPGHHEYEKGCRLLEHWLETAPNVRGIEAEVVTDGWPKDPSILEHANAVFLFSDGSDHSLEAHPLLVGDRLETLGKEMKRGAGLVLMHYSLFVPKQRGGKELTDWIGGFFDYESGSGPRGWYSKISVHDTECRAGSPDHPVCRGIEPFRLEEEFYYNIRFPAGAGKPTPLLLASIPPKEGTEVIAWGLERPDGGRGVGFTGGHFHGNWANPSYRRLVLNALVWAAGIDVPPGGVASTIPADFEFEAGQNPKPIRALLLTGDQHPAHDWKATTKALETIYKADPRFQITLAEDPRTWEEKDFDLHDVLILNYVDHHRPGPSPRTRERLATAVGSGTGLVLVHFANGGFRDWPEFRRLSRRVWIDGKSGHDPYGPFEVRVVDRSNPITRGLEGWRTTDELYFHQQGDEPIDPLVVATSTVTKKDAPLAYVYHYGRGLVFQCLLGHDAPAILNAGTADLFRRGAAQVARRKALGKRIDHASTPRRVPDGAGRFGGGLVPDGIVVAAPPRDEYQRPPLSVECWARLDDKQGFNVLVANGPKTSATHWEIYTVAGSGAFAAFLPGLAPQGIDSGRDVVDGEWHHLAMAYGPGRVRLFVDGEKVADQSVAAGVAVPSPGPLYLGGYAPQRLGCSGVLDEVRLSAGERSFAVPPAEPLAKEAQTLGLWRFDEKGSKRFADLSGLKNDALVDPPFARPGEEPPAPDEPRTYRLTDPRLKVERIDQAATESFLAIRLDSAGRLFVGGRESLFVYEPSEGGYGPRKRLHAFPADAWISDIAIRGDDLYVMTSSALYLLAGARTRREGIAPQRLLWGLPLDLHVSYHCLAWGPEGKLYLSHGDPLLNYGDFRARPDHWGHWTHYLRDGQARFPFTGVGAFLRCNPDGSGLESIAGGVRGPFGLCFDRDGNLFSNDNDHESLPAAYTPARLLHVAAGIDFAWPRGWVPARSPDRFDLVDSLTPSLGRDAPVAMAYYDDPFLPGLRHSLLLARWGQRRIDAYRLAARGASFVAEESNLLAGEGITRPLGVGVGRGGRIFAALSFMKGNEWSPRYPSDLVVITRADDPASLPFDGYEAPAAAPERLWQELEHDSFDRRSTAHQELLRRGGQRLVEAGEKLALSKKENPARKHLVWLAAASRSPQALAAVAAIAADPVDPARAPAAKAYFEFAGAGQAAALAEKLLLDGDPSVRLAAIAGLARREGPLDASLLEAPARSKEPYLRQAATRLLARRGKLEELLALALHRDEPTRLAGVLAIGVRLTTPPADEVPPESLPLGYESPNAAFSIHYADATVDLRGIGRVGSYTTAERWKQLPHSPEQEALFKSLAARLQDGSDLVRDQAAFYLDLLDDPRTRESILKARQRSASERLAVAPARAVETAWLAGPFPDARDSLAPHPPERGPVDPSAALSPSGLRWTKAVAAGGGFSLAGSNGPASWYLAFRLEAKSPRRASLLVEAPGPFRVWQNGAALAASDPLFLSLEPGSNDFLVRASSAGGEGSVVLTVRAAGEIAPSIPEPIAAGGLAERLRNAVSGQASVPPEFLAVDWSKAAAEGDAERGRRLFSADGLGCARCHAILPDQTTSGGPSLAGAGLRFTAAHLVESILAPSRQVADAFRATAVALDDGELLQGLVLGENQAAVELLLPNASRRTIPRERIETRRRLDVSPMPPGLVKTTAELKDLLAYLTSPSPPPP